MSRRLDADTIGCGCVTLIAAAAVTGACSATGIGRTLLGMHHPGSISTLGLLLIPLAAGAAVLVDRKRRRNDDTYLPWRPAVAQFVVFAAAVIAATRVLTAVFGSASLGAAATWAVSAVAGAEWLAEHWWRRPVASLPNPRPGQVWWARIEFEESRRSKDRPCLVLTGRGRRRRVLMFTSQDKAGRSGYLPAPANLWRRPGKSSYLKTGRVIVTRIERFRRYESTADDQFFTEAQRAARS